MKAVLLLTFPLFYVANCTSPPEDDEYYYDYGDYPEGEDVEETDDTELPENDGSDYPKVLFV